MKILKINTDKRKKGNIGEAAAAKTLKKEGYKILEKNYVSDNGEIDLICLDKGTVVFVEVKARSVGKLSPITPRPASNVTPEKQRKIIKVAACYKAQKYPDKRARFDIVEVYLDESDGKVRAEKVMHLVGAFDMNTAYKNPRSH